MIKLSVISLRGAPMAAAPRSAQFGPDGGTIGRAETNTLVLDDPDRTVSRVHAQVMCREGRYVVVDRGSNPMSHNAQPLGPGREAPLVDGDRLTIGSFELEVRTVVPARDPLADLALPVAGGAAQEDPFADLLAGLAPPAASAAARVAPAPASLPDPLAPPAVQARTGADDPFADLLAAVPARPSPGGLDDFSDLAAPPAPKAAGIDDLFGGLDSAGGDPLALSPLADPLRQPNTAGAEDPLAAFGRSPPAGAPARGDHLPIGRFGFVPPVAVPVRDESSPLDELLAPGEATPTLPSGQPAPASAEVSAHAGSGAAPVPPDLLLAAFLRGLGCTHRMPESLTPELMERIGVLLRTASEGTLQLLLTRREFKHQVRAEVTMIAAQANNPLKFSPTAEVALAHLLGPEVRGFMPAEAAMRDAFDDLRAHQFGVMVGMRAALTQLIERFAPDELEKKIAARSALDSLFAANRKARLWDQFVALYAVIAGEAEDDFHALFGKAFVEAYEAQMARLEQARG